MPLSVNFISKAPAKKETTAHYATEMEIRQSYVNTGSEDSVRRGTNASSFMFTTCLRCPNVSSFQNSMPAQIESALFFTLIQAPSVKNAHGMSGDSVVMDLTAVTSILKEYCA